MLQIAAKRANRLPSNQADLQNRPTSRQIAKRSSRPPDKQTSNQTDRYPAARTDICADMPADRQNGSQMLEQQCKHSDNGRYAFRQATDAHPAEQAGRTEWQNRMAEQNGRTEWQTDASRCR